MLDTASNPLQGVSVQVYRSNGTFVTGGTTAADGRYVSGTGLPAGSYFVKTFNSLGFVDRLYNNTVCLNCSVISGQAVTVAAGATVTDIDFALAAGGNISGTVLSAGGTPLQGVFVQIFNDTGGFSVATASTNDAGKFIAKGLPTGSYVAKVSNAPGFIDQLYSGTVCLNCSVSLGTRIPVTVGSTTANINFTLTQGGRIGWTITAAGGGAPIAGVGVGVQVYNATGQFMTSGFTSSAGTYVTSGGLPAGTYYARTFNSVGFINQLHSAITCQSCTTSAGNPIPVTLGATTTVNFSLAVGGSIGGTITDGSSPLAGVSVSISTTSGLFMGSASSNALGVYSVGGLPTGSYVARTFNSLGFIDEQHSDRICLSCSSSGGTPIPVTVGAATSGINFILAPGGRISGTVTEAASGSPLSGISIEIVGASNFFVTSATTDNVGNYVTRAGLPAGNYYARTSNSSGYINVTHPTNTCLGCSVTVGTPIAVGSGTTAGINFALTPGGRITGTITDALTGELLRGVGVTIFLPSGTFVASSFTNGSGVFATQGLPTGTYYARTNNARGYINRLHNAIDCVRCAVASGTPISVTLGGTTSGINFALSPGARITGTITDAVTGAAVPGASVTIFDSAGFGVAGAASNAVGAYTITTGLTTGTYYARTFNQLGYVNKLYNTFPCLQCNVTTGNPIALTAGALTGGIDFALTPGGRVAGTVLSAGAPVVDTFVDVFSSGGTFLTSARTGSTGQYLTGEGLLPGTYYVATENYSGLIDKLYDGVPCSVFLVSGGVSGACAITSGTPVLVGAAATTAGIDFDLAAGGRISGRVLNRATGDPISNAYVNVFNAVGGWVGYGFSDGLGNYTTGTGLPSGTYFVRASVANLNNPYVNQLYNNVACPACDPLTGAAVTVSGTATTPNINFALDTGEVISGTVTGSGDGPADRRSAGKTLGCDGSAHHDRPDERRRPLHDFGRGAGRHVLRPHSQRTWVCG